VTKSEAKKIKRVLATPDLSKVREFADDLREWEVRSAKRLPASIARCG
jgi:hypothetical protein